jgi:restriction endonuclease Mrr
VIPELDDDERRCLRRKARAAVLEALGALGGAASRQALMTRALADGGFTARELAAAPPEAARGKYERLVDHQLAWALTGLRRDGLVDNPSRGEWRLAGAATEPPATAVDEPLPADRLAELRALPYREYLRTAEWRRARAAHRVHHRKFGRPRRAHPALAPEHRSTPARPSLLRRLLRPSAR